MDLEVLERALAERGEPAFRARQVWEWTARGVSGYDEMTNVPRTLRAELDEEVPFSALFVEDQAVASDGTGAVVTGNDATVEPSGTTTLAGSVSAG